MDQNLLYFLVLLFVAVVLISQAVMTPITGRQAHHQKLLKKRLAELAKEHSSNHKQQIQEKYLQSLSPQERKLEGVKWLSRLRQDLQQADIKLKSYQFISIVVSLITLFAALIYFSTANLIYCLGSLPLTLLLTRFYLNQRYAKRLAAFEEQLPEAMDIIKRSLLVGHPFSTSLKSISEEMHDPIAAEFSLTFAEISYGADMRDALMDLVRRNPSVSMLAFASAVLIQKETGGNMAENLEKLSTIIRNRFRFNRKIRTLSAEGRMSAWVLAMVPLALFLLLYVTNPDYLEPLLTSPRGINLIWMAIGGMLIGLFWIKQLLRIEV